MDPPANMVFVEIFWWRGVMGVAAYNRASNVIRQRITGDPRPVDLAVKDQRIAELEAAWLLGVKKESTNLMSIGSTFSCHPTMSL
jgi:hypothetical protein